MAIVYLLTNTKNGKRYVGKTMQPLEVRWGGHVGSARRGDNGMLVCRAIKRHGPEAFERTVLWEGNEKELPVSERELGEWERHFIKELHTHISEGGYNLTFGGDGGLSGYRFSDESREKMRQKALGRKHSEETRAKMRAAAKNRVVSAEVVEKRAAANRGKKRTPEQLANLSAGQFKRWAKKSQEI